MLALRSLQRDPLINPLLQRELGRCDVRASVSVTEGTSKLSLRFFFGAAEGGRMPDVADIVAKTERTFAARLLMLPAP